MLWKNIFLATLFIFMIPFLAYADDGGLVGFWSLDSDSINWDTGVVTDLSGNGNNGTVHNLTSDDEVSGQVAGGLQFNGTNSYISIPVNGSFPASGNSARTVCMWFKPSDDSWTPDVNSIFEYGTAGGSGAFGIDMDSFPNIQFYTWGNDLFVPMGIEGHKTDWLQICWVWDGSNTSLLYSNGVLRGSQTFGGGINTTQTEVVIGRSTLTSGYFPGVIDDVRMYNSAFTGSQVQSLYTAATDPIDISNLASTTAETTANVSWDTATSSDSTVWYGTSSGDYAASTTSASFVTSHSVDITDLSNLASYYYIVVSKDALGDTATSSENVFTTVDLTAPHISDIETMTATTTSDVSWTTNEYASSKIIYSADDSYASSTSETDVETGVMNHSRSLGDMVACSAYNFKVVSSDGAGNYATSSASHFVTTGCIGGATPSSSISTPVTVSVAATSTVTDSGHIFTVSTPANFTATSSSVVVQIKGLPSTSVLDSIGKPSGLTSAASLAFDVTALIDNSTILDSFDTPVSISYSYTDNDISGLDENSLSMYHYHDGQWLALDDCSVDAVAHRVACTAPSFSIFAIFGTPMSNSSSSRSSSNSGESTIQSQVSNLITMGKIDQAEALKKKWYWLFPQTNNSQLGVASMNVRDLNLGMTGEDVMALQKLLNANGFPLAASGVGAPGKETTYFGFLTKSALAKYQSSHNILPNIGYFGPITRASMNASRVLNSWW